MGTVTIVFGKTADALINTGEALYDTAMYSGGKVRNRIDNLKNAPVQNGSVNQTTPALPSNNKKNDSYYTTPGSTISAPGSTKPSSGKSSPNYSSASSYLDSAQNALKRGDLKTAEKYVNKAKKIVNGK